MEWSSFSGSSTSVESCLFLGLRCRRGKASRVERGRNADIKDMAGGWMDHGGVSFPPNKSNEIMTKYPYIPYHMPLFKTVPPTWPRKLRPRRFIKPQ